MVKNLPANAGDVRDADLIPGWGRSPGGGHGTPRQYSCLGNAMDRGLVGYSPRGRKELDMTEATEHTRTPHAQASALPAAAPGTALGGFLLYSVARNLWFGDRGVFSQAACLDDDPPRSHPALPSSAKTGSLGGIFF